jgi:hypothetical protein
VVNPFISSVVVDHREALLALEAGEFKILTGDGNGPKGGGHNRRNSGPVAGSNGSRLKTRIKALDFGPARFLAETAGRKHRQSDHGGA